MIPILTLLTALFVPGDDKADTDEAKLQGSWAITSLVFDGKKTPGEDLKKRELVFRDRSFTALVEGQKKNSLTFTLRPSKSPKQIDLRRDGVKEAALGIYELNGDELKLCYGEPGAARPTEFASKAGGRQFLMVLKRRK